MLFKTENRTKKKNKKKRRKKDRSEEIKREAQGYKMEREKERVENYFKKKKNMKY